jgi:hypothetical protein
LGYPLFNYLKIIACNLRWRDVSRVVESGGVWWVDDERNGEWEGDGVGVRWTRTCGRVGGTWVVGDATVEWCAGCGMVHESGMESGKEWEGE